MIAAIEKIGIERCVGCFACSNVCKIHSAIQMQFDNEGFYKPIITDKCIKCGKCQVVCPVIEYKSTNKLENFYGAWTLDKNILENSSSGGIFSECAKEIFKNNGKVYGAGWENGKLRHMPIENEERLDKLQGSKYIQSNIGNTYQMIREDLKNNQQVLFVGVPCQVAGLYKVLKKDYPNLLTIDLICHGVPSSKVFYKYVKELSSKEFIKANFRDKRLGWMTYSQKYNFVEKETIVLSSGKDLFLRGFLNDLYLNKPCYNCKFKGNLNGDRRIADITLADFWGVPEELYNNNLGTSLVGINNYKGKIFFKKIKRNIFSNKVDFKTALQSNPSFYTSAVKNKKREIFFKNMDKYTMKELEKKYFPRPSFIKNGVHFIKRLIKKFLKIIGVIR